MSKSQTVSGNAVETPKKTFTNWTVFDQMLLAPESITCQTYPPVHSHDGSCHSKLTLTADSLRRHLLAEHGGGLMATLKKVQKPHPIWKELSDLGLEASDFRCEVCDKSLRFHPTSIMNCLKAHRGKSKRIKPGGAFNFTLSLSEPENLFEVDELADAA